MSILPMPMPEDDQRKYLSDRATKFLFEIRGQVVSHLEEFGALADPRLTELLKWVDDRLQLQSAATVSIACGRCGAMFTFSAAVLSQRPATGLYCPFCSGKLPSRL